LSRECRLAASVFAPAVITQFASAQDALIASGDLQARRRRPLQSRVIEGVPEHRDYFLSDKERP
jgi:hypothetical protein